MEQRKALRTAIAESMTGEEVIAKLAEALDLYHGTAGAHFQTVVAINGGVRAHVEHASPLSGGALGAALKAGGVSQLGLPGKPISFAAADAGRR